MQTGSNNPSPPEVAAMRREYQHGELRRGDLKADPFEQFALWLAEAMQAGVVEPNAMSLATAWADGRPSVRTVLLKHFDARGFVFFTNLESKKGRQLAENPHACLLFPWLALERQVIIHGSVEKVSVAETLKYFLLRPRDTQLAAWASRQSSVITSRKVLEMEWERMKARFVAGEVPLPSFWGGFRVRPRDFEFWQGRANRLHDRFLYTQRDDGTWTIDRLAP
jgi:pyridoxamine 5'-phosphate oxidase